MVLGGDFVQIGPVVANDGRHEIVEASWVISTVIWPRLRMFELREQASVMDEWSRSSAE